MSNVFETADCRIQKVVKKMRDFSACLLLQETAAETITWKARVKNEGGSWSQGERRGMGGGDDLGQQALPELSVRDGVVRGGIGPQAPCADPVRRGGPREKDEPGCHLAKLLMPIPTPSPLPLRTNHICDP